MLQNSGECVARASCPECNSSDGVQIFEKPDNKRDAFCFACETHFPYSRVEGLTIVTDNNTNTNTRKPKAGLEDIFNYLSEDLPDRKLRAETLEYFGVKTLSTDGKVTDHFYPSYSKTTRHLQGYKRRVVDRKAFIAIGNTKDSLLFGQLECPINKKLFITEGELDCMALYQMFKDRPATAKYSPSVVSITAGAGNAAKQLVQHVEWLKKFKEIVLVFDSDKAGKEGAEKVAQTLDIPVKIATLDEKDACQMLIAGKMEEMYWTVMRDAQVYQPDGILNASAAFDRYKNRKSVECYPYPKQFPELQRKTYGWRLGSLVTITSGSGMGKTQFSRELKYHMLMNTDFKIADISLEEDVGDTLEGLMALHLNKRLHLPDVEVSEEEEQRAFEELYSKGRLEMYDHFGGCNDEELISRINYFAKVLGCKVFFLDHLSIVISEGADEGDERRRIDSLMTKLAKAVKSLDIVIFMIVHLKKAPQGKSFEEGYVPSSDDLRGSASLKQLSWDVLAISRNQKEPNPTARNTSQLHVLKCRFSGDTGPAGWTYFDQDTGRLIESGNPYEAAEDEFEQEEVHKKF